MHCTRVNMEDSIEFGDLSHDEDFKSRLKDFVGNLEQVEKMIQDFCSLNVYDNLAPAGKVRYELFQAFTITSLYWFYLRLQGIDPNEHEIRLELNRIRELMLRSKSIYEKQTLMPRINQEAAKRFIRSSLWTPNQFDSDKQNEVEENIESKKRKRESDTDDDCCFDDPNVVKEYDDNSDIDDGDDNGDDDNDDTDNNDDDDIKPENCEK